MAQSPPLRPQAWSPPSVQQQSVKRDPQDMLAPPVKRQRLSPNPPSAVPSAGHSPLATSFPNSPYSNIPSYRNFSLPNGAFTPRPSLPNGANTVTPAPPQSQTPSALAMPPPQRPVERQLSQVQIKQEDKQEDGKEKYMDINDLSDLVASSGIDLRREEELMHTSFHHRHIMGQPNNAPAPASSFDLLSRNGFGAAGDRGTLNQPHIQNPEEEVERKHKSAARSFNEKKQFELANPFLQANAVRRRMERIASDNGVKIPMEGLFDKIGSKSEEKTAVVSGQAMTNSKEGLVSATKTAPSILNKSAPLDAILSLLSLSANERCRGLLEDGHELARGRQITTDGIVPPEWAGLVQKPPATEGQPAKATTQPITGSSWDQPSEKSRILEDQRNGDSSDTRQSQETIAFPPQGRSLNKALMEMIRRDRAAEEARIKRRLARKQKRLGAASTNEAETTGSTPGASSGPGTPMPEKAPEVKMTKKEAEKARKAEVLSDTQQTRNANTTMQAQLGGKKYSWLNKKASAVAMNRPGAGLGSVATPKTVDGDARSHLPSSTRDRRFGVWREDGSGGKHVQLRDWISALEVDGREKKTLYYAMAKLGREKD